MMSPSQPEPRILCVDDERRVLEALENHLAMDYDVHLATSGKEALDVLEKSEAFSVVLSDMRMPEMNGAAFLRRVKTGWPDATRMLLTGQSDLESAISAINDGGIFRFLSKPCNPDELGQAIRDAVRQHELIIAERQLLEETLAGAVGVLVEVMGLTMPDAFNRSHALKSYIQHICQALEVDEKWQYELAATVAQLGYITLPQDLLDRFFSGNPLKGPDLTIYQRFPQTGKRLLEGVPRLGAVAQMVGLQLSPPAWDGTSAPQTDEERVAFGANLLAVANAFDGQLLAGATLQDAIETLGASRKELSTKLLTALAGYEGASVEKSPIRSLKLAELTPLMTLEAEIRSPSGQVVVGAGRVLTRALIERLHHFAKGVGVAEPIQVRAPFAKVNNHRKSKH